MAVRVDQAGKDGAALRIDDLGIAAELEFLPTQQPLHLAVVADQYTGEALELAVAAHLQAVGVGDERVREGRGGGEERGERKGQTFHGAEA
jgi:hypothetical protein